MGNHRRQGRRLGGRVWEFPNARAARRRTAGAGSRQLSGLRRGWPFRRDCGRAGVAGLLWDARSSVRSRWRHTISPAVGAMRTARCWRAIGGRLGWRGRGQTHLPGGPVQRWRFSPPLRGTVETRSAAASRSSGRAGVMAVTAASPATTQPETPTCASCGRQHGRASVKAQQRVRLAHPRSSGCLIPCKRCYNTQPPHFEGCRASAGRVRCC